MRYCHKLLRKTAIGMAEELYERLASDDIFHRLNPNRKHWVNLQWPRLVVHARTTLAGMLAMNYPDSLKAEIQDALILDHGIRRINGER